jgi:hypothetical protein
LAVSVSITASNMVRPYLNLLQQALFLLLIRMWAGSSELQEKRERMTDTTCKSNGFYLQEKRGTHARHDVQIKRFLLTHSIATLFALTHSQTYSRTHSIARSTSLFTHTPISLCHSLAHRIDPATQNSQTHKQSYIPTKLDEQLPGTWVVLYDCWKRTLSVPRKNYTPKQHVLYHSPRTHTSHESPHTQRKRSQKTLLQRQ